MSGTPPLSIVGELTIYRALELKPLIVDEVRQRAAPCIDLSAVEEIDTAGLQLLLLAQREAQARGVALRLLSPSAAVRDALELLWLSPRLEAEPQPGAPS
ncbi:STAS domain-containing protein [Roseateles sp.]|uniref:STAS domain-containing protein n=1 Tax=Roseateles sp. TaxID=1971397 RepID=UPI003BAB3F22